MRIGEINSGTTRPAGLSAQASDASAPAAESRALVAVTPVAAGSEPRANHRLATFLAHLIATKEQLPQTRERRRAEPAEALAVYRAAAALIGRV